MSFSEIQLDNIWLRPVNEETMNFAFESYSDEQLMHFLGVDSSEELELEKAKYHAGYATFNKKFLFFHLLIGREKKNIGWCGFHTWYVSHDRAEIGYMIHDESHRNKGYMTLAVDFVLKYGFDEMHLNRIEAFVARYNQPSVRLLQKAGFVHEGTLKQHYFVNNRHEDSEIYALLRKDFHSTAVE